ncbi:sensor domain-containing diguanylate cyclase [Sphingomonas humi]|uniref:diguanylate cyclase n=1 Tax=Sphingomonas humi TaxID=335630 RepID=A0ABP7S6A5_9SPHN
MFKDHSDDPALHALTSLVRDVLGVDVCGVSLLDGDRQFFHAKSSPGTAEALPRVHAPCDHAIRSRDVLIIPDAREDHRLSDNPLVTGEPHIRSYAGAPLTTPDGYNLGALCVLGASPRLFQADEIALLQRFAGLVINQLELRTLAQRDCLTGCLSRRAFLELAEAALRGRAADGAGSALLLFDLDHFKAINDTHGHPAGDQVLRSVGAAVAAIMRKGDLFGRIGGEEFGILLTDVDTAGAHSIADRIRLAISALGQPTCLPVSTSIGLTPASGGMDLSLLLERADEALYRAKRNGRNRVEMA